jgi:hypothetical protein
MMPALLALIPGKDWLYAGIITALLAAFGWYTVHERGVEHAKDMAAAAKVVAKDNAIVAADDSQAKSTETQSAIIYKQAVAVPAIADVGIVCERPAAGNVSLPAADGIAGAGPRDQSADSGSGSTFDPSGALLSRAERADAQIAYLQRRVAELEKQMNAAP